MDRNTIIFLIIILLLFSVFILCSCSPNYLRQQTLDQQQAIMDAGDAVAEVREQYLKCYALNPKEKQACIRQITSKYLSKNQRNSFHYTTNYQYESEKLGFVKFLYEKGQTCDGLAASPTFIVAAKAYLATCRNGNNYFLKFNYEAKEWALIK